LSQQNVSFSDEEELDIRSPKLQPLISYPRFSAREYNDRITEMQSLGITSIILGGRTIVNGIPIAGKGCVGIVVKSKADSKIFALKIRRIDADRNTMDNEARLLSMANNIGVGPHVEGHTKGLIAMEFLTGQSIVDWLRRSTSTIELTKTKLQTVAIAVLEQCFKLDLAGIDHGELSRLARHVIVSKGGAHIIDFESASTTRKSCNVTAAAQSIFLYGPVADRVKKLLDNNIDSEKVIFALRTYKRLKTRANFEAVLGVLRE
jgi:putative serine/threonine protein kinase